MMLAKPPDLPLSDVDWQTTPVAAQALLVMLWAEAQQLRTEVTRLRDQVVSLQDQVANLREQVQRHPGQWAAFEPLPEGLS